MAAVSLDAFGGAVTLSVGGVTHASVAVTPARWNIEYTRCHVKNVCWNIEHRYIQETGGVELQYNVLIKIFFAVVTVRDAVEPC